MNPRLVFLAVLLSAPAFVVPACSCGDNGTGGNGGNGLGGNGGNGQTSSSATTGSGGKGQGGTGGGIILPDGGCKDTCDGGVCLPDGTCCADAKNVCNDACCSGGTVCLFDQCVTPGHACHTAADCDPGQYCETGLGGDPGDGGTDGGDDGGVDGSTCTQPPPAPGRCLDRPPLCPDGGTPDGGMPDGGCIADCEYHPPVGNLNAVQRWTWDNTNAVHKKNYTDIWATPAVGRIYDSNCDGKVDELDPPNIVFVSANSTDANGLGDCCQCVTGADGGSDPQCEKGILRMLDGRTGKEIWSVDHVVLDDGTTSMGFAGMSVAIGDIDGDGRMDIIAATGEGYIVMLDANGNKVRQSDKLIANHNNSLFGWGGGLSIGDMNGDGFPEIAYGASLFTTTNNTITRLWTGAGGCGAEDGGKCLSTFADLDGDGQLELLAGTTAYRFDGTTLWNRMGLTDGFSAVADLDNDGVPEAVLVTQGQLYILAGPTGLTRWGTPFTLPGTGSGGPPTIADFDGDGFPEIGIAQQNFYTVLKPNLGASPKRIDVLWSVPNHDLSSSVTGSSVFDFEGDGKAEVVYADECFLWVFDGATGAVRFATSHTSFTATEASLVADIDGDGHAEMLMVSNSANPADNTGNPNAGWKCLNPDGTPQTVNGVTWQPGPYQGGAYRGLVLFGDQASSWVGTRTLWNQHTYHVSNICDNRDSACPAPNVYGSIPTHETPNWTLPWLNDFRQNVQDKGVFDAPDATVSLQVECTSPVIAHAAVRNIGLASLPSPVTVGVFRKKNGVFTQQVGQADTTHSLFPGQTQTLSIMLDAPAVASDTFVARILVDTANPTFHECRDDNDESDPAKAVCPH